MARASKHLLICMMNLRLELRSHLRIERNIQ